MSEELHGLDWCCIHQLEVPGNKQWAGKPCPYCGNPLPLRSRPYRIAADGTPGATVTQRDLNRVQRHYQLLQAEQPDLAQDELWRRAEQAAASSEGPSDAELSQLVFEEQERQRALAALRIFGVSLRAVVGFMLMCVATGSATVILLTLLLPVSFEEVIPVTVWVWLLLLALLLGPLALGVLASAGRQIERSQGAVRGEALVFGGRLLAAVGSVEMALIILRGAFTPGNL